MDGCEFSTYAIAVDGRVIAYAGRMAAELTCPLGFVWIL